MPFQYPYKNRGACHDSHEDAQENAGDKPKRKAALIFKKV